MKKKLIWTLAIVLAVSTITGCAQKGENKKSSLLTPGSYTATKEGFQREHVTISVKVDENSILDIIVDEVTDHPITIISTPVQQIPQDIMKYQTYNVDSVTGATITSNAIKQAVKDCLEQAGGSEAFSVAVEHAAPVDKEDIETDVLVVGGGGAGMVSAIEASIGDSAKESSGLKVTLIEKAGFLGGNTSVSGGVRYVHEDPTGEYDIAWENQAVENEKAIMQPYMELEFNESLIRGEMQVMKHTNDLLDEIGVNTVDAWGHLKFETTDEHVDPKWNGSYLTYALKPYLDDSDIDIRLNTEAKRLITDDSGAVIGVSVEDQEGTYDIYAKKVILATGGFPHNKELIKKYAPEFVNGIAFAAGTNTGDGFVMATEIGADTVGDKMFGHVGADAIVGQRPDYSSGFYYGINSVMYVNINGERFVNEDKSKYVIYHDLLKQDGEMGWGIIDGNNPDVQVLVESKSEHAHHADTLEALAEELGIPVDNFLATIDSYNTFVDNGQDTEFGTAIERMDRIDEGPYYAFILKPITLSSLVSVKVDGNGRVINTNGENIPNLFAAGDMVLGGNLTSYYFDARGVGTAMYTGNLTGQTAKREVLESKQ